MLELSNLEIHAWHGCNLTCESCSHFSSSGMKGGPSAAECRAWMEPWSRRLRPHIFAVVGGEPTLNRDLADIVAGAGELWPHSTIRVVTNGFLLARHPKLPGVLRAIGGRAYLEVSSHHASDEFQARFAPVRALCDAWRDEFGIDIRVNDYHGRWTRRYDRRGDEIVFLDGDPRAAWRACIGKACKQIYQGKVWKCPPVAYFGLLAERRAVADRWRALVAPYSALDPSCSDEELRAFLALEHEEVCRLCPETLDRFDLPNPLPPGWRVAPELTASA